MKLRLVLPVGLSALALAWSVAALPSQEATFRSNAYLIEFATPPDHPLADQDAARFMDNIKGLRSVRIRHQFKTLLNGVSIEIADPSELQHVQRLESLQTLTPLTIVSLPEFSQSTLNTLVNSALTLTKTDRVHSEFGLTGKGIKVGVIDSGIDYRHPDLGGCFGPNCKVAYGFDFVGNAYNGTNDPVPSKDPLDCAGHGTHVAGTIAANGPKVIGMAPDAILGAYRVIGCSGSTTDDFIIAAMERAVQDGMNVINLSLGGTNGWSGNPIAKAIKRAAKRGILVAVAQGNEGPEGLFSANYVGEGTGSLAVASFINTRAVFATFTTALEPSIKILYTSEASNKTLFSTPQPLVALLNGEKISTACEPLPESLKLTGQVVLVLRGDCFFKIKAANVLARGAVGVLFVNNVDGYLTAGVENVNIKSATISKKDGERITSLLLKAGASEQQGNLTVSTQVTFGEEPTSLVNPAGGSVSDFSSYGPDNYLHIKPDVGAPGENIYSTWMTTNNSYTILSGTSMASPQVAGALALALESLNKQKKPRATTISGQKWTRRVFDAFVSSSKPARVFRNHGAPNAEDLIVDDGNSSMMPIQDESQSIESVVRQGAGMIDVYATILRLGDPSSSADSSQNGSSLFSYTHVLPVMLELNDTDHSKPASEPYKLTIYNQASEAMQYKISHLPAEALNEPFIEQHTAEMSWAVGEFNASSPLVNSARADAEVKLPDELVTVPAGGKRRISVFISPPASLPAEEHWVYSGYIVIKPVMSAGAAPAAASDEAIHVPYAGIKGSMKTLPIFMQNTPEYEIYTKNASQLCQAMGSVLTNKTELSFTMEDKDFPLLSFCLLNPTRSLQLDLFQSEIVNDTESLTMVGRIASNDNVARSPPSKPLTVAYWEGTMEPLGSDSKSTKAIIDDSSIDSASFHPYATARRVSPGSESELAPSSTAKHGTILQERALSNINDDKKSRVPAKNGLYRFRLRALRISGDENNDDDYETYIFPLFKIARP